MRNIEKLTLLLRLVRRFWPWVGTGIARARKLYSFSGFWKKLANQGLVIILSPKDARRILNGTQSCDVLGAEEIQNLFRSIGNQCNIVSDTEEFDEVKFRQNLLTVSRPIHNLVARDLLRIILAIKKLDEAELRQNLLVVGGPNYNQVARSLLRRKEIVYKFKRGDSNRSIIYGRDSTFEQQVHIKRSGDSETVTRDYGIITVMKNPYNLKRKAILACGCRGWGTYAALRLLGDEKYINVLRQFERQFGYFQVRLTCEVEFSVQQEPSLLEETVVQLHYADE